MKYAIIITEVPNMPGQKVEANPRVLVVSSNKLALTPNVAALNESCGDLGAEGDGHGIRFSVVDVLNDVNVGDLLETVSGMYQKSDG